MSGWSGEPRSWVRWILWATLPIGLVLLAASVVMLVIATTSESHTPLRILGTIFNLVTSAVLVTSGAHYRRALTRGDRSEPK